MIPEANPQFPQSRAIIGRRSPGNIALATTFSPRFTIRLTTFLPVDFSLPSSSNCQRSPDKPNKTNKEPETHHNSPQTPKSRFTQGKVVRPHLIDFTSRDENLLS